MYTTCSPLCCSAALSSHAPLMMMSCRLGAELKSSSLVQSTSMCPHCYQLLLPDHQRVRLRPKQRPSARVQSVLRRKSRGKRLSMMQKKLLQRFEKSCSVLARNAVWFSLALWLHVDEQNTTTLTGGEVQHRSRNKEISSLPPPLDE
uniref:Uncharacterized protein n=1 Tax=Labrus bergylta TaxID=56723 RepID=A0A3Q3EEY4_9LABR